MNKVLSYLLMLLAIGNIVTIHWRLDYRVVKIGEKSYKLEVGPQKKDGVYYFPLRFTSEQTGHKVAWLEIERAALVRGQGQNLKFWVGKNEYESLGKKLRLSHAPFIKWNRMLIPIEIVVSEFGLKSTSDDGYNIYMEADEDKLRPRAIDFTLSSQDGDTVNFTEVLNRDSTKCILVNFWSTRCLPCKREMPELVKLYNKYKDNGLVVIGVCTDSDGLEAEREDLLKNLGITYLILLDPLAETYYKWGGLNVPNMSVVNKDGVIIFQHDGFSPDTPSQAEAVIKKELGIK